MSLLTVEGLYQDGRVELTEHPVGVQRSRVMVTFLGDDDGVDRERRQAAGQSLLADMRRGLSFGGQRFDRAEIYDERAAELDNRRSRGR